MKVSNDRRLNLIKVTALRSNYDLIHPISSQKIFEEHFGQILGYQLIQFVRYRVTRTSKRASGRPKLIPGYISRGKNRNTI